MIYELDQEYLRTEIAMTNISRSRCADEAIDAIGAAAIVWCGGQTRVSGGEWHTYSGRGRCLPLAYKHKPE